MLAPKISAKENPFIFVIFGGTGDLTKRKLIPALYHLFTKDKLNSNFAVVSIGRKDISEDQYRDNVKKHLLSIKKTAFDQDAWEKFCEHLLYFKFAFAKEDSSYDELGDYLKGVDNTLGTKGNRMYYLAIPPTQFEGVIRNLSQSGLIQNNEAWKRVIIEKPFGSDLKTAMQLNQNITKWIPEKQIFRIDHYLGKAMVQNIITIRFGNSIFEPLWNHAYIDNIQIVSAEQLGIEGRAPYYEQSGVLKDMLQNHILQMLSLICMEPPVDLSAQAIIHEKVKLLKSLRPFTPLDAKDNVVLGQYGAGVINGEEVLGYRQEENVSDESTVPTFFALKTYVDNFRFGGVPIYIRSGKRMDHKNTQIIVQFKKLPGTHFYDGYQSVAPNILVFKIQPEEGIFFQINAKTPGDEVLVNKVEMDYCHDCKYVNNSPEAYEKLIHEAILDNQSLFTSWEELEWSWRYVEALENALKEQEFSYPNYTAGSNGPKRAEEIIQRDGRAWWAI